MKLLLFIGVILLSKPLGAQELPVCENPDFCCGYHPDAEGVFDSGAHYLMQGKCSGEQPEGIWTFYRRTGEVMTYLQWKDGVLGLLTSSWDHDGDIASLSLSHSEKVYPELKLDWAIQEPHIVSTVKLIEQDRMTLLEYRSDGSLEGFQYGSHHLNPLWDGYRMVFDESGETITEWCRYEDKKRQDCRVNVEEGHAMERPSWEDAPEETHECLLGKFCCSPDMKGVVRVVDSSTEGLGECKKGHAQGPWQWRSLTTQARVEGFFDAQGRKEELWRGWDSEGRRRWEGRYEEGLRVGLWVSYHEGGGVREMLAYKDGSLGYAGLLLREDGTPLRLASFKDGVLEGDAYFFNPETVLTCTCQYQQGTLLACYTWPELLPIEEPRIPTREHKDADLFPPP